MIERIHQQLSDIVFEKWLIEEGIKRDVGQRHLGGNPFTLGTCCDTGESISGFRFVRPRQEGSKVSKRERLSPERD